MKNYMKLMKIVFHKTRSTCEVFFPRGQLMEYLNDSIHPMDIKNSVLSEVNKFSLSENYIPIEPEDAYHMLYYNEVNAINWRKKAYQLYVLLDDIDTADDIAKDNQSLYRNLVRKKHIERFNIIDEPTTDELYNEFHPESLKRNISS